jgi:hypothetical protein
MELIICTLILVFSENFLFGGKFERRESGLEKEERGMMERRKIDPILIGVGPIVLDFPYISEELTDKSN